MLVRYDFYIICIWMRCWQCCSLLCYLCFFLKIMGFQFIIIEAIHIQYQNWDWIFYQDFIGVCFKSMILINVAPKVSWEFQIHWLYMFLSNFLEQHLQIFPVIYISGSTNETTLCWDLMLLFSLMAIITNHKCWTSLLQSQSLCW